MGKRSAGYCYGRVVAGTKTNVNVTFTHYGGDTISGAVNTSQCPELGDKWSSLELRYNGAKVSSSNANILELNKVRCESHVAG